MLVVDVERDLVSLTLAYVEPEKILKFLANTL